MAPAAPAGPTGRIRRRGRRSQIRERRPLEEKTHRRATLPQSCPCSTIAEAGLNFRVRDEIGCGPRSMGGGKNESCELRPASLRWIALNQMPGPLCGIHPLGRDVAPPRGRDVAVKVKPHDRLVLVSFTHRCASTPSLSTSWSRRGLQGAEAPGRSHLGVGFPLRCLQRLSLPQVATRRCRWRDNRFTRAASVPVLSY